VQANTQSHEHSPYYEWPALKPSIPTKMTFASVMRRIGALLNSSESGQITDDQIEAATQNLPDTTTSAPNAHTTRPASTAARATNGPPELTNTAPPQPTRPTQGGQTSPSHRHRRITCTRQTPRAADPVLPGRLVPQLILIYQLILYQHDISC
jgi:hypothetical protein